MKLYLDRPVSVAGVVFSDKSNDESAPQSGGHTEEQVPVLDDAVRLSAEDAGELAGQTKPTDDKNNLHKEQFIRAWCINLRTTLK